MGSPCPPPWTIAGRAAYFGDRICAFCDHRNPAGAKFCNDCASPLHLRPCQHCDAVNDLAATSCHQCGAAWPQSFGTTQAGAVSGAADATPGGATPNGATPGDPGVGAPVTQPPFADTAVSPASRLLGSGHFRLAAVAAMLIVGAYHAYPVDVAKPQAVPVASQPAVAPANAATATPPSAPVEVESTPVEPEATVPLEARMPGVGAEASPVAGLPERPAPVPPTKRASAHRRPAPAGAVKTASAHQRPQREPRATAGAAPRTAHGLAGARTRTRIAQTRRAPQPDQWQLMHVSLARCDGDLIARIVCDQRMRRHYCEGRWGEAPECASGVANEHGQ